MPKPRQRVATGLKISDIMDMPISKLSQYTPKQQREIISRLGSAANKRLKTLQKQDIYNSAVSKLEKSGGKISVRGKTGDDLLKEYVRAREFLSNKFSSATYWKKTIKKLEKSPQLQGMKKPKKDEYIYDENIDEDIPDNIYVDESTNNNYIPVSQLFGLYDAARETNPEILNKLNKYELMKYIEFLSQVEGITDSDEMNERIIKFAESELQKQEYEMNELNTRFSQSIEYDINNIPQRMNRKRKHI